MQTWETVNFIRVLSYGYANENNSQHIFNLIDRGHYDKKTG